MKYSQLPFKTTKFISNDLQSKNAKLLKQAGYIHQEIAGVYTFLPLGLRVLKKVEQIVREEMDKIGIEIEMSSLAPFSNWQKTGRAEKVDVLMKASGANILSQEKNSTEYILNSTHEEIVTPLVQEYVKSYKDLPCAVYQIQTKFRNEPRAKSGLLRCREFVMKDLYSFHTTEEDLKSYYEKAKEAYWNIFERLDLGKKFTYITLASGGDFTPDYSHEYQTVCDAGEDTIFHIKSQNLTYNREVAPSMAPPIQNTNEDMKQRKDIEAPGIIGVDELAKFLKVPMENTVKTILFEIDNKKLIAAAVRGNYDINTEKLKKIVNTEKLELAPAILVKKITSAEIGYAGIINLPQEVTIYFDDSMKGMKNFETGINKTNYHAININFERDIPSPKKFYDFKIAQEGDYYPKTGEKYEVYKACEVGNIFPLNLKFSKAFGYTYVDEKGEQKPVYMGCYGIGPSRLVGVLTEVFADNKGLVWPKQVAPFHIHLISLNQDERADEIYNNLKENGIEVFYDNRNVSAGEKFSDADLMGMPYRLVISKKTGDKIELKERTKQESKLLSLEEVKEKNIALLHKSLSEGDYTFQHLKGISIPKENSDKDRLITAPSVVDRIVHKSLLAVVNPILYPHINTGLSYCGVKENIFGKNTEGKNVRKAIEKLIEHLKEGRYWVLKGDVEKFFDKVPKKDLLDKINSLLAPDTSLSPLLEKIIYFQIGNRSKLEKNSRLIIPPLESDIGVSQGSALSPLFANVYLEDFDRAITEKYGDVMIRYVDDLLLFAKSEDEIKEMKEFVDQYLLKKGLNLSQKQGKTCISNLKTGGIEFLGLKIDRNSIREKDLPKLITYIQKEVFDPKHIDYKHLKNKEKDNEKIRKEKIKLMNQKIQGIFNYYRYYHIEKLTRSINTIISNQIKQYSSYKGLLLLDATKIKEVIPVEEWRAIFRK